MADPLLVIMAGPRSFSSVVSAMLGQHPQMYGLMELNLFAAGSVADMLRGYRMAGDQARHGLLRVLAQLHHGDQSAESVDAAQEWLMRQRGKSTKAIFDHILELINPRIAVEKSPRITFRRDHLERAADMYPGAYFLHLTRHPRTMCQSQIRVTSRNKQWNGRLDANRIRPQNWWLVTQTNILEFSETLAEGQYMRIKGEELISDPHRYLPQVCEWLGVRTDAEAVEAMLHPEESPYACLGPENALYGNDINFLEKPDFRPGPVSEGSLDGVLEWDPGATFNARTRKIAKELGYH
jgi:hypothetical protein